MHDTFINNVKLHIDSIKNEDGKTIVTGWCGSNSVKIEAVRLVKEDKTFCTISGKERKDVAEFYEDQSFLNSGFEGSFSEGYLENLNDVEIEALILGEWVKIRGGDDRGWLENNIDQDVDFKISNNIVPEFLTIDNFYENPDEIRNFALSCDFEEHPQYHKGQRTEQKFIPKGIKEKFESLLNCEIEDWKDQGANGVFQYCTAEDKVVYHVDSQDYAAVIYLTPDAPASCGTTFFKSGRTGLRAAPTTVDSERLNKNKEDLSFEMFRNNFYDKTDLETVDVVGNVYNRLVIWNAQLIHAASEYFGDDKHNSRLFHMFFFNIK